LRQDRIAVAEVRRLAGSSDPQRRARRQRAADGLLKPETAFGVPGDVVGLRAGRVTGEVLAVLGNRQVVVVDPRSGERLRTFTLPGARAIGSVGGTANRVQRGRDVLQCAC
jgi:hypothetical protein